NRRTTGGQGRTVPDKAGLTAKGGLQADKAGQSRINSEGRTTGGQGRTKPEARGPAPSSRVSREARNERAQRKIECSCCPVVFVVHVSHETHRPHQRNADRIGDWRVLRCVS